LPEKSPRSAGLVSRDDGPVVLVVVVPGDELKQV